LDCARRNLIGKIRIEAGHLLGSGPDEKVSREAIL
jgi:hypothetical protein